MSENQRETPSERNRARALGFRAVEFGPLEAPDCGHTHRTVLAALSCKALRGKAIRVRAVDPRDKAAWLTEPGD